MSTSACACFVCVAFSFLDGPTVADLLYFIDKPSLILAECLLFILLFHSFIQAVSCYMFHNNSRAVLMDLESPTTYLLIPSPFQSNDALIHLFSAKGMSSLGVSPTAMFSWDISYGPGSVKDFHTRGVT